MLSGILSTKGWWVKAKEPEWSGPPCGVISKGQESRETFLDICAPPAIKQKREETKRLVGMGMGGKPQNIP